MSTPIVKFDVSQTEALQIKQILTRVLAYDPHRGGRTKRARQQRWQELSMDMAATHANGCPLDLARMVTGSIFDVMHDVIGIRAHLDRDTGQLRDLFRPRFALPRASA